MAIIMSVTGLTKSRYTNKYVQFFCILFYFEYWTCSYWTYNLWNDKQFDSYLLLSLLENCMNKVLYTFIWVHLAFGTSCTLSNICQCNNTFTKVSKQGTYYNSSGSIFLARQVRFHPVHSITECLSLHSNQSFFKDPYIMITQLQQIFGFNEWSLL